jgi:hypothetical protein
MVEEAALAATAQWTWKHFSAYCRFPPGSILFSNHLSSTRYTSTWLKPRFNLNKTQRKHLIYQPSISECRSVLKALLQPGRIAI